MGFKDNKNGTMTDTITGLTWLKSPDTEAVMTWDKAQQYVKNLSDAGISKWRLPTKDELFAIAKCGGRAPSDWLSAQGFDTIQWGFYWTSTPHETNKDRYYYLDLGTGELGAHPSINQYFIWACY